MNAGSWEDLDQQLASFESTAIASTQLKTQVCRPVLLCFGGQVSTFIGLDRDLFDRVTILRSYLDQCNSACKSLGLQGIYPHIFQKSPIQDIVTLQTTLFATQYACAKVWISCGVKVAAVVGHSFGELVALAVADVYSVKDALKLVSGRAALIRDTWGSDKGSMMAVEADEDDVQKLLAKVSKLCEGQKDSLSIACYNSSTAFTLGGSAKGVEIAADLVKTDPAFSGLRAKQLNVTNAFHSALVDPLIPGLKALGQDVVFNEPQIRIELATEKHTTEPLKADFVAQHMRNPVHFKNAVDRLVEEFPDAIWLEAGSNSSIASMANRAIGKTSSRSNHFQPINITSDNSFHHLVDATTKLWKEGLNVTFWPHYKSQVAEYTPVILPTYQFEQSRHWMDLSMPPKPEHILVEHVEEVKDSPKGLTIFIGYLDEDKKQARYQVNTAIDRFQKPVTANFVAQTAVVTPGMLQLEIALDALSDLRPDLKESFTPELRGMTHHSALLLDNSKAIHVDLVANDEDDLTWQWTLSTTDSTDSTTIHTSGTITFHSLDDSRLSYDLQSLARLSGRKRCADLLDGNSADEVLQNRNIYRAFEQVVDYGELFRNTTKIVSNNSFHF